MPYRTGNHWGVTIVFEGDGLPDQDGRRAGDQLAAVVVNGDTGLAQRICDLLNGEAGARAELAELEALFELQQKRMEKATARWRAEDPEGRALRLPDLGALLQWLMDDADHARNS